MDCTSDYTILQNINQNSIYVEDSHMFGYISKFTSLKDVITVLLDLCDANTLSAAAAYGMLLTANQIDKNGVCISDSTELLNNLVFTKAKIDVATFHSPPVISVTSEILNNAQKFMNDHTIPCTEWPSVIELLEVVKSSALKYVGNFQWRLLQYDQNGCVAGSYVVEDKKDL